MSYRKKFIVEPGSKVRLARINPVEKGVNATRDAAAAQTQAQIERMDRLQYLLYADASQSLLIVLQALDAGGKDGVIRHLFTGMNPQGTSVAAFKQPSQAELAHDFLWRVHQHAPGKGEVAIFNRSHYEDAVVGRAHGRMSRSDWKRVCDEIIEFEQMLAASRTCIVKFYLHISPQEQLSRFKQRLDDPARNWKISESDYTERALWPKYIKAYEDTIARTSTKWAPWYVIPANHKWFRNLAISEIIADTMDDMKLKLPSARTNLDEIREKFRAAELRSDSS
jgi:PPK2 family polyphosphate:nucleotide phosphotransferase